eukprot:scaffold3238_cov240-Pinguiococcus_pyrenoidosus.AAC.3
MASPCFIQKCGPYSTVPPSFWTSLARNTENPPPDGMKYALRATSMISSSGKPPRRRSTLLAPAFKKKSATEWTYKQDLSGTSMGLNVSSMCAAPMMTTRLPANEIFSMAFAKYESGRTSRACCRYLMSLFSISCVETPFSSRTSPRRKCTTTTSLSRPPSLPPAAFSRLRITCNTALA